MYKMILIVAIVSSLTAYAGYEMGGGRAMAEDERERVNHEIMVKELADNEWKRVANNCYALVDGIELERASMAADRLRAAEADKDAALWYSLDKRNGIFTQ